MKIENSSSNYSLVFWDHSNQIGGQMLASWPSSLFIRQVQRADHHTDKRLLYK